MRIKKIIEAPATVKILSPQDSDFFQKPVISILRITLNVCQCRLRSTGKPQCGRFAIAIVFFAHPTLFHECKPPSPGEVGQGAEIGEIPSF